MTYNIPMYLNLVNRIDKKSQKAKQEHEWNLALIHTNKKKAFQNGYWPFEPFVQFTHKLM